VSGVVLALSLAACAEPAREEREVTPVRFEGVAEWVAGEPVFQAEIDELVGRGVPEDRARERLRAIALLSAEARRASLDVRPEALDLARRRAAVQALLRDLRRTTDTPSAAAIEARHEAIEDPRPLEEVRDELREAIENEWTFARLVDLVSRLDEEHPVEAFPDALPDTTRLDFDGERP